ncbi:hypothetical protein [Enterovibrio coralii]|uniref:Uncharacterized protein n=1 Tax=Enterovibrio coralii TaxID=294935 RepID=A0A135I5S4_9GAMM|nr:hypothetical protein [Enterovibrio coralii]KXF80799.1 hypothetical protein ATN88_16100 [Enterovibrio coralii]
MEFQTFIEVIVYDLDSTKDVYNASKSNYQKGDELLRLCEEKQSHLFVLYTDQESRKNFELALENINICTTFIEKPFNLNMLKYEMSRGLFS